MSPDRINRIVRAIKECDKFINKESPRNADTRPADMLNHLNFCIAHKAKLIAMLSDAWEA